MEYHHIRQEFESVLGWVTAKRVSKHFVATQNKMQPILPDNPTSPVVVYWGWDAVWRAASGYRGQYLNSEYEWYARIHMICFVLHVCARWTCMKSQTVNA